MLCTGNVSVDELHTHWKLFFLVCKRRACFKLHGIFGLALETTGFVWRLRSWKGSPWRRGRQCTELADDPSAALSAGARGDPETFVFRAGSGDCQLSEMSCRPNLGSHPFRSENSSSAEHRPRPQAHGALDFSCSSRPAALRRQGPEEAPAVRPPAWLPVGSQGRAPLAGKPHNNYNFTFIMCIRCVWGTWG